MLKVLFFARYREQFLSPCLELEKQAIQSVAQLMATLEQGYGSRVAFLKDKNLVIAVNQCVVKVDHILESGDVIAFYPPVTGG